MRNFLFRLKKHIIRESQFCAQTFIGDFQLLEFSVSFNTRYTLVSSSSCFILFLVWLPKPFFPSFSIEKEREKESHSPFLSSLGHLDRSFTQLPIPHLNSLPSQFVILILPRSHLFSPQGNSLLFGTNEIRGRKEAGRTRRRSRSRRAQTSPR